MFATLSSKYEGWYICPSVGFGLFLCPNTNIAIYGVLTPCGVLMHPQPFVDGLSNGKWCAVLFFAHMLKNLRYV